MDKDKSPIPLEEMRTVPTFPIDCLPPVLKDYVGAVAEATQTPIDMGAVSALAITALCLQGKYLVRGNPNWDEPVNLYSLVIANSASRKSSLQGFFTKPIYEFENQENKRRLPKITATNNQRDVLYKQLAQTKEKLGKGQGNISEMENIQSDIDNLVLIKPLRLLADDITTEALISLMAENNDRMGIASPEGGLFKNMAGRYTGNPDIDIYLKSHPNDPVHIDRKGRASEYLEQPCLTMLVAIQPSVLQEIISNPTFRGTGLLARFIYTYPETNIGSRSYVTKEIPAEISKSYYNLCHQLLEQSLDTAAVITLSKEAQQLSKQFFDTLEPRLHPTKGDLADMSDWAGKLHGLILRIAGNLHIVEAATSASRQPTEPISGNTLQKAVEIGYYLLEHAKACYNLLQPSEEIGKAKFVLKKIMDKQITEPTTPSSLWLFCKSRFDNTDAIRPTLELLVEHNQLLKDDNKYRLNPVITT